MHGRAFCSCVVSVNGAGLRRAPSCFAHCVKGMGRRNGEFRLGLKILTMLDKFVLAQPAITGTPMLGGQTVAAVARRLIVTLIDRVTVRAQPQLTPLTKLRFSSHVHPAPGPGLVTRAIWCATEPARAPGSRYYRCVPWISISTHVMARQRKPAAPATSPPAERAAANPTRSLDHLQQIRFSTVASASLSSLTAAASAASEVRTVQEQIESDWKAERENPQLNV
eukprot:2727470-Rhodomonas_salina.1